MRKRRREKGRGEERRRKERIAFAVSVAISGYWLSFYAAAVVECFGSCVERDIGGREIQ